MHQWRLLTTLFGLLVMTSILITPLAAAPITPTKPGNNPKTQKGKIYQTGSIRGTVAYTDFEDVKQLQKAQDQGDYIAEKAIIDRTWTMKKQAVLDGGTEAAVMEIKRTGKAGIWCRVKLRSGENFWVKDRSLVKNGSMTISTKKPQMYEVPPTIEVRQEIAEPGLIVKNAIAWKEDDTMNKLLSTLGLENPGAAFLREHRSKIPDEWTIKTQVRRAGNIIDGVMDRGYVPGTDQEQIKYLHASVIPKAEESGAVRKLSAKEKVSIIQQNDDIDYGKITKIKTEDGKIWWVRTRDVVKDISF